MLNIAVRTKSRIGLMSAFFQGASSCPRLVPPVIRIRLLDFVRAPSYDLTWPYEVSLPAEIT